MIEQPQLPLGATPKPLRSALPAALKAALRDVPPPARRGEDRPLIGSVPDWSAAACKSAPTQVFFPTDGRTYSPRKIRRQFCRDCPLQAECMTWALLNEPHGLWGLTPWERMALGGVGTRRYTRSPAAAAADAVADGISPDNLAAALRTVQKVNAVQKSTTSKRTAGAAKYREGDHQARRTA